MRLPQTTPAPANHQLTNDDTLPAAHPRVVALHDYGNNQNPTRLGLIILVLGLGGFLLWAALAPLDEGVPTDGVVNVESSHKTVQHLSGGIINKIMVREGQSVQAGDVLFTLDDTASKARFDEVRQRYMGLRAQESRLTAEKTGASSISFNQDLIQQQDDPYIQQLMLNQSQLLRARQQALFADVEAMRESIQGQTVLIDGYKGVLISYESQRNLLNEQLAGIKQLVSEGYAPRNQQNELEQKLAQTYGQIASTESNILRSQKSILELNQRISARQQTEKKEIDTEMAQVKLAVQADAEKYKPLKDELQRVTVTAPVSGQVVGLQVHTIGAVIQPGQKIMDIVPFGEPLILDAKIPPHLIDKIHVGQDADVRFSSFSNTPQLLLEGQVKTVSTDLLLEPGSGSQPAFSYYLARVNITEQGMKTLGDRRLQPGMPVQIVIRTGERTLLTYLMHPLVKRIAASMKEE
ncbi:HlyD family type I secretion periplasmic adaptor subunit [Methylobacillus gramineus]|uniref:HlyD family type I secretion periplasmic adaptor subunit n=1 Tax=Methylobacillus gramineus TaxID=755169 RepID=UPI001CFFF7B2|nr:HlyD family type I secretion periplasmic adaptor subunit [Methylobacillus gramineus]MCB5183839.1 HlyD family type I secretion periplasmic adaptor subunit [Methylobacillus gramineus]